MISKKKAAEIEARIEKDFALLDALISKFAINPNQKNAYFRLSVALARKHYPNGVKPVGRPRNMCVSRFVKQMRRGKRGGRPESKKELRRELLRAVDGIRAEHGLNGRGSDKKALEILIEELAKDTKQSKLRMEGKYLAAWQKDLSRARLLNRKNK